MKNVFLFLLAILTLSVACSDDDEFITEHERLLGFWLLNDVTGGIAGDGYEANFDHLQFNDNSRYALMIFDAVVQEGTYTLSKENDQLIIQFNPTTADNEVFDDHSKTVIFSEGDSKLTLSDPCCDLFVYQFEIEQG